MEVKLQLQEEPVHEEAHDIHASENDYATQSLREGPSLSRMCLSQLDDTLAPCDQ